MTNPILDTALEALAAGCSIVPIRADGSKSPAVPWKPYTEHAPDEATVRAWFTGTNHGLGIVTGPVSGQLEMVEIEGRAANDLPQLRQLAEDTGLGDLWNRITTGWTETSPSGGFHFHYRLTDQVVPGNTKLARDEAGLVLAETRGAGGQVVVAPTPGTHHPSGHPPTRLTGGPTTPAPLTSH
uniref:bifunctional DNA primase/polymerase n=1 Tax=Salana multivorans TaxID=120377 RepID=UPI0024919558